MLEKLFGKERVRFYEEDGKNPELVIYKKR